MEIIKIDLTPSCMKPVLRASQYDNGREWPCEVLKDGTPYKFVEGDVCEIHVRKGDGCGVTASVPVTVGQSSITITSTEQMCAVYGDNIGELVVTNGTKKIGSCNLILSVEADPMNGSKSSNSEIHDLQNQVNDCVDEALSHKGASDVAFDNTDTGLEANNVQSAIEEVNTKTDAKADSDDVYDKTYLNGIFDQIDNAFTGVNNALGTKANTTDVNNALANKMDKSNPTGTGSFSMNRSAGTTVGFCSATLGGRNPEASGDYSVALGDMAMARGEYSFAVGKARSSGRFSTAIGNGVIAQGDNQFVFGKNNIVDTENKYAEIVGNGLYSLVGVLSNARTLDWNGNETLAGDLTFNGNKSLTSEISRLDNRITDLPEPMVLKGTLGVGGTIETLPTASASNEGWTFKCITAGTYEGLTLKVGDTVTCFNPPNTSNYYWDKTGSQDTDTDTWRNIKVNGVEKLGNGISSGSVDFVGSENIDVEFDANGNKVGVKTKNIYTKTEVDDIVYGILPDDTASGSVANFNTSLALPIKSLEVDVNAVQEAGTPTPSTPKAISGWNAITLDVNGTTEVINLGGTYYGGHFTQDKAGHRQFEVTHDIISFGNINFSRSNNGGAWQSYLFYAQITDKTNGGILKCSNYEYVVQAIASMQNEKIVAVSTNKYIYIRDDAYTTVPDFKTANTNTQLVYPLATPYTIDLPDGEPIITLNGTNNIYADTGDCAVEYKVSIEEYVSNHSGGGLGGGLLGGGLGGAKSGGGEEEPDEGEDTEKTKLDDPKEEIKTIGDTKKLGGE